MEIKIIISILKKYCMPPFKGDIFFDLSVDHLKSCPFSIFLLICFKVANLGTLIDSREYITR